MQSQPRSAHQRNDMFEWRFAGRPIVACLKMFTRMVLFIFQFEEHKDRTKTLLLPITFKNVEEDVS